MIKLSFFIVRLPHLSRIEFHDYWRLTHAPLVESFKVPLKIKRYVQQRALPDDSLSAPLRGVRGAPGVPYDGIAEIWWDKIEDIMSSDPAARSAGKALLEDEKKFIDLAKSPMWISNEFEIFSRV